jgi:signal transduction histidine kinase
MEEGGTGEFLARAGLELGQSLDYRATLQRAARVGLPALGDWCVVDVIEDGEVRPAAAAHVDAERDRQLQDPQGLHRLREAGAGARLTVPLEARGRAIGSMTFVADGGDRRYGPPELACAEELARRAALAIDNARLYREAQQAIALRDEFLSVASHELNTPLAALTLTLQALGEATGSGAAASAGSAPLDAPTIARMAALAERQGKRLTRLVGDLLDATRIQRGALALRIEPVDLGRHVREVVKGFQPKLQGAGCQASLDLGEDPVVGRWDPARIEQVLLNLLSNAIKFGAGRPIEIRVDRTDGMARLAVTDHGPGIDPDRRPRIFERFEPGAAAQQHEGLGLGLHISRHIVESHGGSMSVESQPGQGATFVVHLPCAGPPGYPATNAAMK